MCDFNAILHRILSKGFCARVYFHFWNCINVLKNHQSIWFWQRVHGREPRIRCLCMREIHLQQGWQFNSRKMNGLFIKCIGKLIINLKKKSENTPHFISCTKKKTTQLSKCIKNIKSETKSQWPHIKSESQNKFPSQALKLENCTIKTYVSNYAKS